MNPVQSSRDAGVAYVVKKTRKIDPCISVGMKIPQTEESAESVSANTSTSSVVRGWLTTSSHLLHQDSKISLIVFGARSMKAFFYLWTSSSTRLEPGKT
eukprot:3936520-Amphidinium_carterae.1